MRKKKENVPIKAKICTVIAGMIVVAVCAFSLYAEMPSCKIKSIDNPLWGIFMIGVLLLALAILYWGYNSDNKK